MRRIKFLSLLLSVSLGISGLSVTGYAAEFSSDTSVEEVMEFVDSSEEIFEEAPAEVADVYEFEETETFLVEENTEQLYADTERIPEPVSEEAEQLHAEADVFSDDAVSEKIFESSEELPEESEGSFAEKLTTGNMEISHEGIIQEGAVSPKQTDVILNEVWENGLIQCLETQMFPLEVAHLEIPAEQISDVLMLFLNRHPEYFWVSFDSCDVLDGVVVRLYMTADGLNASGTEAKLEAAVKEALSVIDPDMSELEKALALHDYLVLNAEYNYDGYLNYSLDDADYTAYGILVNKTGVCQGYSLAYQLLLERLGIPCVYVSSWQMNHGWNMVKIGGKWYHVDVTWDDPVWDTPGQVYHEHFMVSDAHISSMEKPHVGWTSDYKATSTKYDKGAFWENVVSGMWYNNGYWYFIQEEYLNGYQCVGSVKKQKSTDKSATVLKTVNDTWPAVSGGGYWIGNFSRLVLKNGKLFYNTPTEIKQMNLDGSNCITAAAPKLKNQYIYGLTYTDGKFWYVPSAEPFSDGKKKKYEITIAGASGSSSSSKIKSAKPGGVKVTSAAYNKLKISWNKVDSATGYEIYRKESGKWKKIGTAGASATSYVQKSTKAHPILTGTTYSYKVRAYRTANKKTTYSQYSSIVKGKTKLTKPTWKSISKVSKGIKLQWKKVTGASGYEVQRYENGKWVTKKTVTKAKTVTYTDKKVKKNKTYKYRIRAYRTVNGKKVYSAVSAVKSKKYK